MPLGDVFTIQVSLLEALRAFKHIIRSPSLYSRGPVVFVGACFVFKGKLSTREAEKLSGMAKFEFR